MKNTSTLTRLGPTCGEALRQLPEDLRRCLGPDCLLQLAFDAVQAIAPAAGALAATGELNPRMVLTLLTYCYASGIASSEDVAGAATTDATVRYICAGQIPSGLEIRHFRRANRPLLQACLAHTLAAACAWDWSARGAVGQWEDPGVRGWMQGDVSPDEMLLGAGRRVERAIQFDTAASE